MQANEWTKTPNLFSTPCGKWTFCNISRKDIAAIAKLNAEESISDSEREERFAEIFGSLIVEGDRNTFLDFFFPMLQPCIEDLVGFASGKELKFLKLVK